ncbi:cytochrome P450 71A9-like [Phalaenopsis equestris]|uniref:cytochrome P450 71A9-like n=1 Tax=Phalaenopsis equestris TaxID=78828 RepID=UPI0009E2501E|nr:cytochrome P450 71A9-like [Phalaenopsis equestris]
MGPLVVLLLILLAVSLPLLKKLAEGNRAGKKLPPGPWRLPIIGNLHQVGSMPHRSFLRLSQKHGPLMFLYLGSIPTLVVSSADALKSIFKSHDIIFSGRPASKAGTLYSFNNSNISFAQYGENWRQARKLSMLELLSPRRVRSFQIVREQEVANLSAAITELSSKSSLINLSEMISALSYNVLCRVVFGDKLGGGAGVYRGQRSLSHGVMAETQNLLVGFFAADFFPAGDWIDGITGQRAKLEKNFGQLNMFWERVIEKHLKSGSEKAVDDVSDREDLVDVLLRLRREATDGGFLSTMNHVKGIMADLFFAGTDTSSATIIWTMTELMKNPRVMTKLQQELQTAIINNNKVEESELQRLEYLKLVIKESLRMHPPAPLLVPRETLDSCVIEGYDIPAKTRVFINATAISIDPKAWKNPNEFWPERFALRGTDLREQDFNYVPFGVGRRSCPGIDFAAVLVELVLANLLHCFEWSLPDGMRPEDIDMGEASGLTMHKKVPLCMVAKPMM